MTDLNAELDKLMNEEINNIKKKADLKNKSAKSETTIYCKGPREDLLNFHLQSLMYIYNKCNNKIMNKLNKDDGLIINELKKNSPEVQKTGRNSIWTV